MIDSLTDLNSLKEYITNLQNSNFKSLIMKDLLNRSNTDITNINDLKTLLKKKIKYDFYTTGYEGIFINENIMGIIKYLAETGLKDSQGNTYTAENIKQKLNITDQDISKLNVNRQLAISRILAHSNNTKQLDDPTDLSNQDNCDDQPAQPAQAAQPAQSSQLIPWKQDLQITQAKQAQAKKIQSLSRKETVEQYKSDNGAKLIECPDIPKQLFYISQNLDDNKPETINKAEYTYDKDNLESTFDLVNNDYRSDRMFTFSNPLIKNILGPYLGSGKIETFLLFYLFGNDDKELRELKCKNQYLLLESTRSFIEAINPE